MGTLNTDKSWIAYGKKDPYFGVLSDDKFLDKNLSEERLADFFNTGKGYVDDLFKTIHDHVDPNFAPKAVLDFGCGTGRLIIPFAKRAEKAVGVDISPDILEIARQNAVKNNLQNLEFYVSDDNLTKIANQKFDLINTFIVLQHINVTRGERLIEVMVKLLNHNGIGSIHIPYFKAKPPIRKLVSFFRVRIPFVHNAINVLEGKSIKSPLMQMNVYDINRIMYILQSEGISNCYLEYINDDGMLGVKLIFQKK